MNFDDVFVASGSIQLNGIHELIEAAKNSLPHYRETWREAGHEAELRLKNSGWKDLLEFSGINFVGLICCSAQLPSGVDLTSEFKRMLSVAQDSLGEECFSVQKEFQAKLAHSGQGNEVIGITINQGKISLSYKTGFQVGIEKEAALRAVISEAGIPVKIERRSEGYFLIPESDDLEFNINYMRASGADAREFSCEMPCKSPQDLLPKMDAIVAAIEDGSPVKGVWDYLHSSDAENLSPWRKELIILSSNDFKFKEVEISTSYSIDNLDTLYRLTRLGTGKTWFRTVLGTFEYSQGEGYGDLTIETTPKGHRVFVTLTDADYIKTINKVLPLKFTRSRDY